MAKISEFEQWLLAGKQHLQRLKDDVASAERYSEAVTSERDRVIDELAEFLPTQDGVVCTSDEMAALPLPHGSALQPASAPSPAGSAVWSGSDCTDTDSD